MDWFAIVSLGVYPTPTPTGAQRAAYAVSFGLLSVVYESAVSIIERGLTLMGFGLILR